MKFAEESPEGRAASKALARAHAAMRRLESSVIDSPKPGYARNAYGAYFRLEVFERVLALAAEAEALSHLDGGVGYAVAGFLSWAGYFDRAAYAYESVIASYPDYLQPARLGVAVAYGHLGRVRDAQDAVDAYNLALSRHPSPGMPPLSLERLGFRQQG